MMDKLRAVLEALKGHTAKVTGSGQKPDPDEETPDIAKDAPTSKDKARGKAYDRQKLQAAKLLKKIFNLTPQARAASQAMLVKDKEYHFVQQFNLGREWRMLDLYGKLAMKPKSQELYKGPSRQKMNLVWQKMQKQLAAKGYKTV